MANPNERKIPMIVMAISALVGALVLFCLHAVRPVFVIAVIYALNSLVLAIISQWWKISVHTGTFASIATIAVIIFGPKFWWLYLILIPLAWSRIYRKRHSLWQTTFGALVTTVITLLVFFVFGYV